MNIKITKVSNGYQVIIANKAPEVFSCLSAAEDYATNGGDAEAYRAYYAA